jgi:flagellar basal body P-ring formation protein FlgA
MKGFAMGQSGQWNWHRCWVTLARWLLVSASVFCMTSIQAQTQTAAEVQDSAAVYTRAQTWLNNAIGQIDSKTLPLRMEVVVGELDRKLRLAACQEVEPYLPSGTRLWGKTRLGLRCLRGEVKWNVFLPITVKAFGTAWAIKGGVAQGGLLSEADAMQVEVDWAELNSPIIANLPDWVGQTAARNLGTGQAIRQDMVRPTMVFQAGEQVRVVAQGGGFEIATSGFAVSSGVIGQSARVRMDNGRVLTGQVMGSRTVRLAL